jgi:hypothetical protein
VADQTVAPSAALFSANLMALRHSHLLVFCVVRAAFVIAVGVLVGGLAIAGCGHSPHGNESHSPVSPSSAAPVPATTTAVAPTATTSGTTVAASETPVTLPISVESDTEMQSAGNDGPSSSILAPTSCVLVGRRLTAAGGYTNGGFAPNVYNRYGDVVELYAYTSASGGAEVAEPGSERRPPIGGFGKWQVIAEITNSLGLPSRCVVAAQPTHDVQLAP